MARSRVDKTYRSFINGLVTEASGLTYPENSCRDLDNVDIEISGLARRRLGLSQESGGQLVAGGAIDDTFFTNDTGGPLSSSPSIAGATVEKSYLEDGSTDPTGDWTLSKEANGNTGQGAYVDSNKFYLWMDRGGGQPGPRISYMQQDLDVNSYDRISVSFNTAEMTSNEGYLFLLIGGNTSGAGQGFAFGEGGLYQIAVDNRTESFGELNAGNKLLNRNFEASRHTVSVVLSKIATNSYLGDISVRDSSGVLVYTSNNLELSTLDGFLEFFARSTQTNSGRWEVKNIYITLELFEVGEDSPDDTVNDNEFAISTHLWSAPNGDGTKNFQVFQVGNTLFFRDLEQEAVSNITGTFVPEASAELSFDGVGTGFIYNTTSSEAAKVKLQSTTGAGRIWFTSKAVVPFYAELSDDGATIILKAVGSEYATVGVEAVTGKRSIRDVNGVEDYLDLDETPTTLTEEHLYNLLNQGWPSSRINTYFTSETSYPSNAMQWFLGKTGDDTFDPDLLLVQDFGTSRSPRGRTIIDALLGSKDGIAHSVSGIDSPIDFEEAEDEKATTGWQTIAFYAGRIWYAGEANSKRPGCVYFSKTLQTPKDASILMQVNDPTSEHYNDLLATDGGYIPIPEADDIRKLVPYGAGILVFAGNGVWFVYGGEGGFTANNYSVEKLTSTGIIGADTVVRTDQAVYFWADNSVHVVVYNDQSPLPIVQDIGQSRIFKYYQLISRDARNNATSCYDPIAKKAFWFWLDDDDAVNYPSLYNRALILDTRTSAFTTYSFTVDKNTLIGPCCAFPRETPTEPSTTEVVFDSTGETVVDSNMDDVFVFVTDNNLSVNDLVNSIKVVVVSGPEQGIRIAEFFDLGFKDYTDFPGIEQANYTSYLVPGEEILGDLQRNKTITYLNSYFLRTETGFYEDLTPRKPSGCTVVARWDWHVTAAGNRWSNSQVAYRYKRAYSPVDADDTFDTGEEIVYTKLKLRGWGRAVTLKYESVEGKDFRLLGYALAFSADGVG